MLNFLREIIKEKLLEINFRKSKVSFLKLLKILLRIKYYKISFRNLIIGEIKFFTPILGKISLNKNLFEISKFYISFGLSNFSVLTDKIFFGGNYTYVSILKSRYFNKLNILRKDFILDSYQIYESLIIGSDIILIISYILKYSFLLKLFKLLKILNSFFIFEIFSLKDLKKLFKFHKFVLIGINNRNLYNSEINKFKAINILKYIKCKIPVIIESGISKNIEVKFYTSIFLGLLIGEFLIKKYNERFMF
ncbi:hypothetical protein [Candidatus Vidania fulgoroideorum]